MLTGVTASIAIILTATGYGARRPVLALMGSGGWLVLGLVAYSLATTQWDGYYLLFIFSLIICVAVLFDSGYSLVTMFTGQGDKLSLREKAQELIRRKQEEKENSEFVHPMDKKRMAKKLPPIHSDSAKQARRERDMMRDLK